MIPMCNCLREFVIENTRNYREGNLFLFIEELSCFVYLERYVIN